jgi:hypothetical protein
MKFMQLTFCVYVLVWMMPMLAVADAKNAGTMHKLTRHDGRDSGLGLPVHASSRNALGDKQSDPASQGNATSEEEDCE